MLYTTVVHNDTHTREQFLKVECLFTFRFIFCAFVWVEYFVCFLL